jgi:uncharacterized LabA/DUF88 family protein
MSDAVHAFVDGAYLRKRADELGEPWADPARIALQALAADMRNILERPVEVRSLLSRVTYYDALPPQGEPDPEDIDGYCKAIELLPNTHLGFGFLRGKPRRQKGVDTLIAVDMLEGAYLKAYSRALLIAGDADYVPAIQAVQRTGINVVVAAVEDCRCRTTFGGLSIDSFQSGQKLARMTFRGS